MEALNAATRQPSSDIFVADETSMVDVMLMQSLDEGRCNRTALLVVGDDRPASVVTGQVLADIIASGAVPVVRLEVLWAAVRPGAHRINQGSIPDLNPPENASEFALRGRGSRNGCRPA